MLREFAQTGEYDLVLALSSDKLPRGTVAGVSRSELYHY